jgi:hypothetical protein
MSARRHHRSLTQQTLSDLQMACGGDARQRRRQALDELRALANEQGNRPFIPPQTN